METSKIPSRKLTSSRWASAASSALLAAWLLAPALAVATESVRWYDFRFRGQKVGYVKSWEVETRVDGEPAIEVHQESRTELARMGQEIVIESSIVATARPDGTPLRFTHVRTEGGQTRRIEGERSGDGFAIIQKIGAQRQKDVLDLKPGMVLASTIAPLFYDDLEKGSSRNGVAISENEGDAQPYAYRVASVRGEGTNRRFVVDEEQGGIESRSIVRPDGTVERTEVAAMGAEFVLTDAAQAERLDRAVDIFDEALFSASAPIPDRDRLKTLIVSLRRTDDRAPDVPGDRRQRVKREGSKVRVTLSALPPPEGSARIPVKGEHAAFLKGTPYETLEDPALRAASEEAIGEATHVWPATQRLVRFVYEHIREKSLSRAFTSASEALESREGDCTEHAVLFSALAKIAGIPTRLVTGLVYIGGPKHTFGYHEWVEVWTGTAWHPADPTFGQNTADPTHIKFATGQSDPAGLRKAGIVAGSLIGNLRMDVIAYELDDGETVRLP